MHFYHSFDFWIMLAASTAVLVSFLLFVLARKTFAHWRTYSLLSNVLSLYLVVISMKFGDDPRSLVAVACWNGMMFMALANTQREELSKL